MIQIFDHKYHYSSIFDPLTGQGVRSNVFDPLGKDTGVDPWMGSFPELLDIGIMGHCEHGKSGLCLKSGVQCYQDGQGIDEPNMPLDQFKRLIDECKGRTFQIALGGRGDPDMHEDIGEILKYAYENNVVPNFTTSGYGLDEELLPIIKKYCGAVAVSWYRNEYTTRALNKLIANGIRTNVHFVLSNRSIDEAIEMMRDKKYPAGINRIIFLLHKPVGLGSEDNVLSFHDPRVSTFFALFDDKETADKSGFDSCSVPALLNFTSKINPMCIEACEAGRFSAYVSPDNKLFPCSFEKDPTFGIPLNSTGIEAAWNSPTFDRFRSRQIGKCVSCPKYSSCYAGCPVVPQITLCNSEYNSMQREVTQ
jgi:radical SAM protein with 4Fe4S-binding SPASM domain